MRVLLAGIAGGVAMFVWMTIAHMFLNLGSTGISELPNDAPVLAAMQQSIGERDGFYYFPSTGVSEQEAMQPEAMRAYAEKLRTTPSGILVYHPPGAEMNLVRNLGLEFANELLQSIIAAFLVSFAALKGFFSRTLFVVAAGGMTALAGYVSYWIWYGFPVSLTLMGVGLTLVAYAVAGLAIAAVLGVKAKSAAPAKPA